MMKDWISSGLKWTSGSMMNGKQIFVAHKGTSISRSQLYLKGEDVWKRLNWRCWIFWLKKLACFKSILEDLSMAVFIWSRGFRRMVRLHARWPSANIWANTLVEMARAADDPVTKRQVKDAGRRGRGEGKELYCSKIHGQFFNGNIFILQIWSTDCSHEQQNEHHGIQELRQWVSNETFATGLWWETVAYSVRGYFQYRTWISIFLFILPDGEEREAGFIDAGRLFLFLGLNNAIARMRRSGVPRCINLGRRLCGFNGHDESAGWKTRRSRSWRNYLHAEF